MYVSRRKSDCDKCSSIFICKDSKTQKGFICMFSPWTERTNLTTPSWTWNKYRLEIDVIRLEVERRPQKITMELRLHANTNLGSLLTICVSIIKQMFYMYWVMSVDVDFRDFFMRFLFISCHWCVCKSHFVWIYMCIADVKWISRLRNLVNKRRKLPFAWNANLTRICIFFFSFPSFFLLFPLFCFSYIQFLHTFHTCHVIMMYTPNMVLILSVIFP